MSAEVVFVPGFMQRGAAWEEVAREVGERYPSRCLDFSTWTFEERVAELLGAAPPGTAVVGYSLGGRVALHAAVREPGRFAALALVGATPGIEDEGERRARVSADDELAAWMERAAIDEVVERWERLPVFAGQPEELSSRDRLLSVHALVQSGGRAAGAALPPVVIGDGRRRWRTSPPASLPPGSRSAGTAASRRRSRR